jgi:hypothetical protein
MIETSVIARSRAGYSRICKFRIAKLKTSLEPRGGCAHTHTRVRALIEAVDAAQLAPPSAWFLQRRCQETQPPAEREPASRLG